MDRRAPPSNRFAKPALAILLGAAGVWITATFLPALVWAVVIAIAIDPLYAKWEARWPSPRGRALLAAGVTIGVALLLLVPVALGVLRAAREAHDLATWAASARANGVPVPAWIAQLPFGVDTVTRWWQINLATPEGTERQLHRLAGTSIIYQSRLIGSGLLHRAVIFSFTLIALFFLLRDRQSVVGQFSVASGRLLGETAHRIGRQALLSVRGTIDGLVLVGIGEGAVMALAYVILGVPHPLLLGALTAVAAMIPFGAALLIAIAAILLVVQGAVGGAIAVIIAGIVVVGVADHFVRPLLIGGATRLPFIWVLIGILGGVERFGLLGLFIGPATMAVLILLWREFVDGAGIADQASATLALPSTGASSPRE